MNKNKIIEQAAFRAWRKLSAGIEYTDYDVTKHVNHLCRFGHWQMVDKLEMQTETMNRIIRAQKETNEKKVFEILSGGE